MRTTGGSSCRPRSATSTTPPAPSSTTRPPSSPVSTWDAIRDAGPQDRGRLRLRRGVVHHAEPVGQARGRRAGHQPVRGSTSGGPPPSTANATPSRRGKRSSGASRASLGVVFTPGGEQLTVIDDTGRVLTPDQLLLAPSISAAGRRSVAEVPGSPCPCRPPARPPRWSEARNGSVSAHPTAPAAIMAGGADPAVVAFAADAHGRYMIPDFMPAFDATATFREPARPARRDRRSLSEVVDELPEVHIGRRDSSSPRGTRRVAVMRSLVEQSADRRGRPGRRGADPSRRGNLGAGPPRSRGADHPGDRPRRSPTDGGGERSPPSTVRRIEQLVRQLSGHPHAGRACVRFRT